MSYSKSSKRGFEWIREKSSKEYVKRECTVLYWCVLVRGEVLLVYVNGVLVVFVKVSCACVCGFFLQRRGGSREMVCGRSCSAQLATRQRNGGGGVRRYTRPAVVQSVRTRRVSVVTCASSSSAPAAEPYEKAAALRALDDGALSSALGQAKQKLMGMRFEMATRRADFDYSAYKQMRRNVRTHVTHISLPAARGTMINRYSTCRD